MLNWTAVSIAVPISGGMMGGGKSICNRAELKRCDFGIPIYGKTRNAFVTRFSMNSGTRAASIAAIHKTGEIR